MGFRSRFREQKRFNLLCRRHELVFSRKSTLTVGSCRILIFHLPNPGVQARKKKTAKVFTSMFSGTLSGVHVCMKVLEARSYLA